MDPNSHQHSAAATTAAASASSSSSSLSANNGSVASTDSGRIINNDVSTVSPTPPSHNNNTGVAGSTCHAEAQQESVDDTIVVVSTLETDVVGIVPTTTMTTTASSSNNNTKRPSSSSSSTTTSSSPCEVIGNLNNCRKRARIDVDGMVSSMDVTVVTNKATDVVKTILDEPTTSVKKELPFIKEEDGTTATKPKMKKIKKKKFSTILYGMMSAGLNKPRDILKEKEELRKTLGGGNFMKVEKI